MRESRTYGSGRGACHEMHVPTATDGASSLRCSAARRRRGRSRRARSSPSRYVASASCLAPRMIRKSRRNSLRSETASKDSVGRRDAMCKLTIALHPPR